MTVRELIEKLETLPKEWPVKIWYDSSPRCDVNNIRLLQKTEVDKPDFCDAPEPMWIVVFDCDNDSEDYRISRGYRTVEFRAGAD